MPQRNVIHERAVFHKRSQQVGETMEEYVRALYDLAETAGFPDKENTIRDRLVLGVLDSQLSEKLQLEADLTLHKAITMARQHELVKNQIQTQRCSSEEDHELSFVQRARGRGLQRRRDGQNSRGHPMSSGNTGACGGGRTDVLIQDCRSTHVQRRWQPGRLCHDYFHFG